MNHYPLKCRQNTCNPTTIDPTFYFAKIFHFGASVLPISVDDMIQKIVVGKLLKQLYPLSSTILWTLFYVQVDFQMTFVMFIFLFESNNSFFLCAIILID